MLYVSKNFYNLNIYFKNGGNIMYSVGGVRQSLNVKNTQKRLRQSAQIFITYTFCQKNRQKIVENGYLQIRKNGV